ncbi:UDP-3-O-[3-hydroxymyristoyl] N-acetylglucosamine deacetylase [Candidatus Rubidus massiliensis]|nr:UDP-3-O-[3-hydroxymyristoyl] N-acetylglucosamine deacetylase [Candidatus Rubidus massiliensis]
MTIQSSLAIDHRSQYTIKKNIEFSGIGIHTGQTVSMKFEPAPAGTGIVFCRVDLPGKPMIPATLEYVCDTSRSTTIGIKNIVIHTIEHVMAAIRAFQIDNLIISIDNVEPPVANGSSDVFVKMIEEAGIVPLKEHKPIINIKDPIYYSDNDVHLVAIPHDSYKISYTLNYPDVPALKSQFFSTEINAQTFKKDLAPCRTFSLYKEVSWLMDKGLIKGGSLSNAVIIHEEAIFSKEGLFFPDEMVRHKMLDMVGDLSLIGFEFNAHIMAIKAGHPSNFAFAKKILNYITSETNA